MERLREILRKEAVVGEDNARDSNDARSILVTPAKSTRTVDRTNPRDAL